MSVNSIIINNNLQILHKIGISIYNWFDIEKPIARIKKKVTDFIVQEITPSGEICSFLPVTNNFYFDYPINFPYITCVLVKKSLDTYQAIDKISHKLQIPINYIHIAGLKDKRAITAQRISIKEANFKNLQLLNIPNINLHTFRISDRHINTGELQGNSFSILVRIRNFLSIKDKHIKDLKKVKKILQYKPIPNFYGIQRFGGNVMSHIVGKYILMGKYEKAIKSLFISNENLERADIVKTRSEILKNWGNWEKCIRLCNKYYSIFNYERKLLVYLRDNDNLDFRGALLHNSAMTRIMLYAYHSYLFNKLLSKLIMTNKNISNKLPLLCNNPEIINFYKGKLPEEQINDNYDDLNLISSTPSYVGTFVFVKNFDFQERDNGVILKFSLPKGVYATNLLNFLYTFLIKDKLVIIP